MNADEVKKLDDLKINALTAAVERAIEGLGPRWWDQRHRTARELRELLDLQSSGNPGQLSDPVTDRHDVNWGPCPECGCTDLAFTGWPHGSLQDVLCALCGWSGVFVDKESAQREPPHESG